ncbi:MAG TPA: peptidylprolyl isomerase, partial [Phycisphaerae bacterium]|nr:peptidylprolyl isomerase [Phycisphaerae bacterium]
MKKILSPFMALLPLLLLGQTTAPAPDQVPLPDGLYTQITTESGIVVCELFYKKTPMTVAHYVGLAEGTVGPRKGEQFFEGLKWFRVEANFVIQGGDHAQGSGGGGDGRVTEPSFPDEIVPGLRHDGPGTLQMANAGPDTNGSQYCLMITDQTGLNYDHTVFGKVVRGLDLLTKFKVGDTMHVKILRVGKEAEAYHPTQESFDKLVASARRYTAPKVAGPDTFLDDPDNIIGVGGRGSNFLQIKLANFERFTGERIMARVFAHTPADAVGGGEKEESFLKALQQKLGVNEHGALVVFFQDQNKWLIRIAPGSQKNFLAGPMKKDGTRDPADAKPTLDDAITAFMTTNTSSTRWRATIAPPGAATASAPATATTPATTPGRRGRGGAAAPR